MWWIASESTSLFLERKLFGAVDGQEEGEAANNCLDDLEYLADGQNLKLKLCLFLESLFAAINVGVAL